MDMIFFLLALNAYPVLVLGILGLTSMIALGYGTYHLILTNYYFIYDYSKIQSMIDAYPKVREIVDMFKNIPTIYTGVPGMITYDPNNHLIMDTAILYPKVSIMIVNGVTLSIWGIIIYGIFLLSREMKEVKNKA